jgi:hypothetical protein
LDYIPIVACLAVSVIGVDRFADQIL